MVTLILGILMTIGGIASAIYGNYMNNDLMSQIQSYYGSGYENPGTIWIWLGVAAIVIGVILILCGVRSISSENNVNRELGSTYATQYQKRMLREYQEQLDNGVISREQYEQKKAELLGAGK